MPPGVSGHRRLCRLRVGQVQPRQPLLWKYVPCGAKQFSMIERTDMEICQSRQTDGFASQRRSTPGAKAPLGLPRRRLELGDLALGNGVRGAFEGGVRCELDQPVCTK